MKISVAILLFVLSLLTSCKNHHKTNKPDNIPVDSSKIDASIDSLIIDEENVLCYVLSVAEGYHYDSLKQIAIESGNILHYSFDPLGRIFNKNKNRLTLPEDDADEMWAGEYFLRRESGDKVSIEMCAAYPPISIQNNQSLLKKFTADTTKMFVCASIFTNQQEADSLKNLLQPKFAQVKIIPTIIYMGCMH